MNKQPQSTKHKLERSPAVSYLHHARSFSNNYEVTAKGGLRACFILMYEIIHHSQVASKYEVYYFNIRFSIPFFLISL